MSKTKIVFYASFLILFLLSACISKNGYEENIKPSEIRESQTTNEVALTNLNLGIAYLKQGNYNKALEKLKKSLIADSDYAPTYNVLGLLYQQLGDNSKAEENFKRALAFNSVDSSTLNNYGNFLCKLGRLSEAEGAFIKAAKNPLYDAPEIAITNAGQCLYQNKKIGSAEKYFRQALQLNPQIPQALIKMSEINFDNKKFLSSRAYLQRYQEISPHNARTLLLGIKVENALGDQDAASSYKLLLKNSFPDSNEFAELKNLTTAENEEALVNRNVAKNTPAQTPEVINEPTPTEIIDEPTPTEIIDEPTPTEIIDGNVQDKQSIEASINKWVDAWSNQDVDGYLASYAKEFIPSKGLSKNRWEKERTERLLVPSFIKITLSNLKINMRGKNYARVDFTQTYKSDTYKDRAKKELLMEKIDGEWLIIKEK